MSTDGPSTTYDYLDSDRVQCPKCGEMMDLPLHSQSGRALEYVGVCQTWHERVGSCGATLVLRVVAHALPVARQQAGGPTLGA